MVPIKPRILFALIFGGAAFSLSHPSIGAIRWDAYHAPRTNVEHGGLGGPVVALMASLGPQAYHYRVPFFGKITGTNSVRLEGYSPEILGREMAYAKAGGLSYWAFLLYEEGNSMSEGLETYLKHPGRGQMPFCAIASGSTFRGSGEFMARSARLTGLMADPAYFRIPDGRPLLYLYNLRASQIDAWGGPGRAKALFQSFKGEVARIAGKEPFFILLVDNPDEGAELAAIMGAEALSSYAVSAPRQNASPYRDLTRAATGFWERCLATGLGAVPICMAGWDRRPRIEHPVPWEKYQKPGEGMERHHLMPSPEELAAHIKEGMDFAASYQSRCAAQTLLVYAWNEHDEGGFLCPTLFENGATNDLRLRALSNMLATYVAPPPKVLPPPLLVQSLPMNGLSLWYDPSHPKGLDRLAGQITLRNLCAQGPDASPLGEVSARGEGPGRVFLSLERGTLTVPAFKAKGQLTAFVVSRRPVAGGAPQGRLLSAKNGEVDWRSPSWCLALGRETAPYPARVSVARGQEVETSGLAIGSEYGSDLSRFPGEVGEILIYQRALDGAEIRFIKKYLETKWEESNPR